jgi:hypothetical protein
VQRLGVLGAGWKPVPCHFYLSLSLSLSLSVPTLSHRCPIGSSRLGVLTSGVTDKTPKGRKRWYIFDKLTNQTDEDWRLAKYEEDMAGTVKKIVECLRALGGDSCPAEGDYEHDYAKCEAPFHFLQQVRVRHLLSGHIGCDFGVNPGVFVLKHDGY